MTWVLEEAPINDPVKLLILYALADRAGADGCAAFPAHAEIAKRARCSTRTVARHLKEMEADGVIRRGDQSLVSHYASNRRPVVWDINFDYEPAETSWGDTDVCPDNLSAQTDSDVWGDTPGNSGVTAVSDKPSLLPTGETVLKPSLARTPRGTRLPEDWTPDPDLVEEMRLERPDVDPDFETRKFVDYWCAKAGSAATKKDWRRTWRNWIRSARATPGRPANGMSRADQKVATYLSYGRPTQVRDPKELA